MNISGTVILSTVFKVLHFLFLQWWLPKKYKAEGAEEAAAKADQEALKRDKRADEVRKDTEHSTDDDLDQWVLHPKNRTNND